MVNYIIGACILVSCLVAFVVSLNMILKYKLQKNNDETLSKIEVSKLEIEKMKLGIEKDKKDDVNSLLESLNKEVQK